MTQRKFGLDRHRPPGDWVQATTLEAVVGISRCHDAATAFAAAVERAESVGLYYGLQLKIDPANPHDQNAIKVWGVATRRRLFFGETNRSWHIGFVAAKLAEELQEDLISKGQPIAAELHAVSLNGIFVNVGLIVLAPPGYGLSSRARGR